VAHETKLNNNIIRRILISLSRNGFKSTLVKIINKLSYLIIKNKRKRNYKDYFKLSFRYLQPISYKHVNNKYSGKKRINLVLLSIKNEYLDYNNIAVCIIIAHELAKRFNYSLRIITRLSDIRMNDYSNIMKLYGLETLTGVTFFSDYQRNILGKGIARLDVSDSDIFFASSWATAFSIKYIRHDSPFFYIIQNDETLSYPNDDEHLLCTTILNDTNIRFIASGKYLFDYFKIHFVNICKNGTFFETALLHSNPKRILTDKSKFILLLDARPDNVKSLFFYGLYILNKCIELEIIDNSKWEIYYSGDNVPLFDFCKPINHANLDDLNWKKHKDIINSIDISLSLVYVPYSGFPNFDIVANGGVVVSNIFPQNNDSIYSENAILTNLDENSLIENMKKAVILAQNIPQREKNFNKSRFPLPLNKSLNPVFTFFERNINAF
jgi:hypothetical protein